MPLFLDDTVLWAICVPVSIIILIAIIILAIFTIKGIRRDNVVASNNIDYETWINIFGGLDNIVEAKAIGSRLTVVLKDKEKVNKTLLTSLKPLSTMFMSTKTVIVISYASKIADYINSKLK